MKKITAILKDLCKEAELKNKENRVKNAIEAAKLNAETDLMEVDEEMGNIVQELNKENTSAVLERLCYVISKKRATQDAISVLKEVEEYLFSEVEPVKKSK